MINREDGLWYASHSICGWKSHGWDTRAMARSVLTAHLRWHERHPPNERRPREIPGSKPWWR